MKINLYKPEGNNHHIIQVTANVATLVITTLLFLAFVAVGIASLHRGIKELFEPKATYFVYHCWKGKKVERVPAVIDGVIKTEADIWNLVADLEVKSRCKVIIEPNWRTVRAEKTKIQD